MPVVGPVNVGSEFDQLTQHLGVLLGFEARGEIIHPVERRIFRWVTDAPRTLDEALAPLAQLCRSSFS